VEPASTTVSPNTAEPTVTLAAYGEKTRLDRHPQTRPLFVDHQQHADNFNCQYIVHMRQEVWQQI
jgi:hypothetical protein